MEHPPSAAQVESHAAGADERRIVEAISAGDEAAFVQLVQRHGATMLRVAQLYVTSRAVAEEVVQEAWLGVLVGIERFEGRSSLKTWLFRILANRAQSRAAAEGRSVPFSALSDEEVAAAELSVDRARFHGPGARWADHWTSSPKRWSELPEESALLRETVEVVERTVASLPPAQRAVVTLRDLVGWSAEEVCELLEISAANQRVLLHRGRTKVRQALDRHLASS